MLLAVQIGEQRFAVDIMAVREIRGWTPSTALPHAPSYVKGVVNLRGVIIPVVSLAERLGFSPKAPTSSSVVVVVEAKGCVVGLLLDAVCDIITVTPDKIQETPVIGSKRCAGMVQGLIALEDGIVSIISLATILPEGVVQEDLQAA